jgi:hypothetical protein
MFKRMTCGLAPLLLIGCMGDEAERPVRMFNEQQFIGLISTEVTGYQDAMLDYELDDSQGGSAHFSHCAQVETTYEEDIEPSQFPLFDLLSVNCLALRHYAESQPAQHGYFPSGLTAALVAAFPADAVPRISDEEIVRRQGKALAGYEGALQVAIEPNGSAQIMTMNDEITYNLMARADFDEDGNEDLLMRVDWHARDGFGEGSDLLMLSKTSDPGPVFVSWRR